jgi:hypothetical protein
VTRSTFAWIATASEIWITPLDTMPGGKPVTADPGLKPTSPSTVVAPVLVIVDPAKMANDSAVPRSTGEGPFDGACGNVTIAWLRIPPSGSYVFVH